MLLKYFYDNKIAHASYLVGCQATGEALVVDPGRDIAPYVAAAADNDMQIVSVTETHIHADFVSGARELAEQVGAKLYLSDEGDQEWKYEYLADYNHELIYDGSMFKIGNIKIEVIHTPGHTPEHVSFLVTDTAGANQPIGIFTGDFVFVGDIGRPDLLEEAAKMMGTAEPGARRMWQSLQRFRQLPDYIQAWPAHGAGSACGKALGAIPSSTVGYEKLFNWAFQYEDEDAFVKALLSGQPEAPKYFAMMKKLNKTGPAVLDGLPQPAQLNEQQLQVALAEGLKVIDVRPSEAFAEKHIPGTINIPLDRSFTNWAGWLLDYDQPFYLIVDQTSANEIVRDLIYIGLDNIGGVFDPAVVETWRGTQSYTVIRPADIAERIINGEVVVLDVRGSSEWQEGHLPNAQHIMLGYLPDHLQEVPTDKPVVVQCLSGGRSAIGASVLQASGLTNVINLAGGYQAWAAAKLPIERE